MVKKMDMTEQEISTSEPAYLRFNESQYLHDCFVDSCGPPRDSYFKMIVYFDAFLFTFISIEEIVTDEKKMILNNLSVFKFLKAARNITTHHSVLAAPNQAREFERPFSRIIQDGNTGIASANLRVRIKKFREIFALARDRYPRGARGFQESEAYLCQLEEDGKDNVFIEKTMSEGLRSVSNVLGFSA